MYSGIPDLYNTTKVPHTSHSVMVSSSYNTSDDQLVPCSLPYSYSPAPVATSNLAHPGYTDQPLIDYAPVGQGPFSQSGFMPPVVEPMQSAAGSLYGTHSEAWNHNGVRESVVNINPAKIPANPPRKGGRKPKTNKLPPAEEEKRRVRRIRNKLAAAKCRQRRMDHTLTLVGETEVLEDEQSRMEQEIARLKQIKDHYEYILRTHTPTCAKRQQHQQQQQQHQHRHTMAPSSSLMGQQQTAGRAENGAGISKNLMTAPAPQHHLRPSRAATMAPPSLSLETCAASFRRSSSSEGDLHSPLLTSL